MQVLIEAAIILVPGETLTSTKRSQGKPFVTHCVSEERIWQKSGCSHCFTTGWRVSHSARIDLACPPARARCQLARMTSNLIVHLTSHGLLVRGRSAASVVRARDTSVRRFVSPQSKPVTEDWVMLHKPAKVCPPPQRLPQPGDQILQGVLLHPPPRALTQPQRKLFAGLPAIPRQTRVGATTSQQLFREQAWHPRTFCPSTMSMAWEPSHTSSAEEAHCGMAGRFPLERHGVQVAGSSVPPGCDARGTSASVCWTSSIQTLTLSSPMVSVSHFFEICARSFTTLPGGGGGTGSSLAINYTWLVAY